MEEKERYTHTLAASVHLQTMIEASNDLRKAMDHATKDKVELLQLTNGNPEHLNRFLDLSKRILMANEGLQYYLIDYILEDPYITSKAKIELRKTRKIQQERMKTHRTFYEGLEKQLATYKEGQA